MPSVASEAFDLIRIFDALEGVDSLVVGGVAAALHGAPRLTFDLDIVPEASEANVDRLAAAMQALDARVREPGERLSADEPPRGVRDCEAGGPDLADQGAPLAVDGGTVGAAPAGSCGSPAPSRSRCTTT